MKDAIDGSPAKMMIYSKPLEDKGKPVTTF